MWDLCYITFLVIKTKNVYITTKVAQHLIIPMNSSKLEDI